jgi:hypothetical protein
MILSCSRFVSAVLLPLVGVHTMQSSTPSLFGSVLVSRLGCSHVVLLVLVHSAASDSFLTSYVPAGSLCELRQNGSSVFTEHWRMWYTVDILIMHSVGTVKTLCIMYAI